MAFSPDNPTTATQQQLFTREEELNNLKKQIEPLQKKLEDMKYGFILVVAVCVALFLGFLVALAYANAKHTTQRSQQSPSTPHRIVATTSPLSVSAQQRSSV